MADELPWWFTQNEEHLHGSRQTRDEEIAAGTHEFGGQPFMICQGGRFRYQAPHIDIEIIAEQFDNANDEISDPEGENPAAAWSDDACHELEAALTATMDAWLDKHGYRDAWAIDCGAYERITP